MQTLTPYMQSTAARAIVRIVDSDSSNKTQANFSMELWKTAFMDACERLCPVRAAGHDCGCLPVLSRLVTNLLLLLSYIHTYTSFICNVF